MILRILVLTCAVFVTPSFSLNGMTLNEFTKWFEHGCFQQDINTDPYLINGQENPLSNTMENFIALAEKFEVANPNLQLKDELLYFIRNYMFENIRLNTEGTKLNVGETETDSAVFTETDFLWEPDMSSRNRLEGVNDPFSDAEKCSLYYMISHSIVDRPKEVVEAGPRIYENISLSREYRSELPIQEYYPQEIGVVAIRGTDAAVSLSRVLAGLYVGLNPNRKKPLTDFGGNVAQVPVDQLPEYKDVDPLYTITMAEVLMLSKWKVTTRLAPNGMWMSTPLGPNGRIDGFCPTVHKQENTFASYSYSSVRGAADGLILGMIVPSVEGKNAKLSQILRMYYSRDGIGPKVQTNEKFYPSRVSFCNRLDAIVPLEEALEQQMRLYGFLVSKKYNNVEEIVQRAKKQYAALKRDIYEITHTELTEYCRKSLSLDKPEDLPRKTFLDIFVMMDSRFSETAFQTQQMIVGYLAKYMDLRYTGSRMTIIIDQKVINSASNTAEIDLKKVVDDTYSSSCAACTAGQIVYERSDVERDQIVLAIDQLLVERKNNETKYNGANGKVVVFFNFENDSPRNNKVQTSSRLETAIKEFHLRHQDALVYAVGLDPAALAKFARNDPGAVFLAADGNEEEVAKNLYKKISVAPAILQYTDCADGRGENSAIYENFVSPLALQHWFMPAKYFYKSINLKVMFEASGPIRVCHNRATMSPENIEKYCKNTTTSNKIEFKLSNPCKNLNDITCSPFYFSVIGGNGGNGDSRQRDFCDDTRDNWCSTLDDIKFKVTHEGVRCSGSLGLGAHPFAILLTLLLTYFLYKKL